MTVLDLISSAMRLIGTLAQGETASNDEAADVLIALNDMLDGWSSERENIFLVQQKQYVLGLNRQTYQIGPTAADFVDPRPIQIQNANIVLAGTTIRLALDLLTATEWGAIREQGVFGNVPEKLYCDYATPNSKLYLWPIPNDVSPHNLELFTWSALGPYALGDTFALPPAYSKAIRYNLAVNIAPEFGLPIDPLVASIALAEKAAMRQLNLKSVPGGMVGEATTGQVPTRGVPPAQQAA